MRTTILLIIISLLFKASPLYSQSEVLTIEKNDGVTVNYSFDSHPKVTFDDNELMVSTDITEVRYPLSELKRYSITKSDEPFNSQNIVIDENELSSFSNLSEIKNCDIYYKRNFDDTEWQALYVPFDIDINLINDDFDVAVINNFHQYDDDNDGVFDRTVLEVRKVTGRKILMANYPYLIRAKVSGEKTITIPDATLYPTEIYSIDCSSVELKYIFTGTYETISDLRVMGCYTLKSGKLEKSYTSTDALPPLRWYMQITPRSEQFKNNPIVVQSRAIVIREISDDATTINEVYDNNAYLQTEAYRFDGTKVTTPQHGLYIMKMDDGVYRKVMVK